MKNEIMNPHHFDWYKFIDKLVGPEGCNFRDGEKGTTWNCKGGHDKSLSRKILLKYWKGVSLLKTFAYFDDHGGHCDCEVVFNVCHEGKPEDGHA